jgi:hypothetical protein
MIPALKPRIPRKDLSPGASIYYYIEVKPYTIKELCALYQICDKTLSRWLQPFRPQIGMPNGRFYTVLQVEMIFTKLGVPYVLTEPA